MAGGPVSGWLQPKLQARRPGPVHTHLPGAHVPGGRGGHSRGPVHAIGAYRGDEGSSSGGVFLLFLCSVRDCSCYLALGELLLPSVCSEGRGERSWELSSAFLRMWLTFSLQMLWVSQGSPGCCSSGQYSLVLLVGRCFLGHQFAVEAVAVAVSAVYLTGQWGTGPLSC